MSQLFALKLTAAIAIAGEIKTAGAVVKVDKATAADLLRRGKAEPQGDQPGDAADAEDQEHGQTAVQTEQAPKSTKRKAAQ